MKSTDNAINLIKSFEQLRLNSYLCPAGVWTIGYGHTDGVNQGMLITEKTADAFLKQDIQRAESEVNRIKQDLTQGQFDALVSFSYNLGTGWTNSSNLKNILLNSYGTLQTGKMTGKVTASSGLYLRQSPSSSASVITLLKRGETVEIVDNNKYNTVWYKVKTSSGQTGYCSSTYLNVTSSGGSQTGRDLNYVNRNALINEMLAYHHAGGVCYYGLLYRRADELEMFLYGDYTSDGRRNKYGFPNPSCISW